MRIDVAVTGYDSAAEAVHTANHVAASAYDSLTGMLAGYHALGGDDTSSEVFVREYDESAREAVQALRALVDALGAVGDVAAASGANHRRANEDSVYRRPVPTYDRGPQGEGAVTVAAFTPPTALGGDNEDMPDWWNHVVDHLQGWGWPSANSDQLRSAAAAWRAAGRTVDGLTSQMDSAISQLEAQRSPEIATATGVLRTVRGDIRELADCLQDLGDACEDYATQVDQTRQTIKDLLRDLAIECGVTAGLSVGLSFVTFGGAAVVGGGVIAARAVRYARLVLAALRGLRAARAVGRIATTAPRIVRVRLALERLRKARRIADTFRRTGRGTRIGREALNAKQAKNLKRFEKKLPADARETVVSRLPDGSISYTSQVPGRVPGSYAEYTKVVDDVGDTIRYIKTTHGPDGKIIHIKDKMQP